MVVKSNKMPIQENHSVLKQFTIAAKFKAKTVQHLTHANGQPDRVMSNAKIAENVNDRELFSELIDNPINPLLIHMVPPFMDEKDPMFSLQINGEAVWESRQVYGHPMSAFDLIPPTKHSTVTIPAFLFIPGPHWKCSSRKHQTLLPKNKSHHKR